MKILILIKSLSHFSYVSSVVENLTNGNEIELRFDKDWSKRQSSKKVREFVSKYNVSVGWFEKRKRFRKLIFTLREFATCVWYSKRTDQVPFYKKRWLGYIPLILRPLATVFPKLDVEWMIPMKKPSWYPDW